MINTQLSLWPLRRITPLTAKLMLGLFLLGLLCFSGAHPSPAQSSPSNPAHYLALGDSYASGFGLGSYLPGTHQDSPSGNDCQRSTLAYSTEVAKNLGLPLEFHACQGAVTADLLHPRAGDWHEGAQLTTVTAQSRVVSVSIGGNDAHFGEIIRDCIDGLELLPFNTCYHDPKVTQPVASAFARLAGKSPQPANITPLSQIFHEISHRAPQATRIAVGYPHLFPPQGGSRVPWPGARCEGIKEVDQRWIVQRIDELNEIIRYQAYTEGLRYAEPNPAMAGHELCGVADPWFYPLLSPGRFHPNSAGHQAMAETVLQLAKEAPAKSLSAAPTVNHRPSGEISVHRLGADIEFKAQNLRDLDGTISKVEWYATGSHSTARFTGTSLRLPLAGQPAQTITLIITDNQGAASFYDLIWLPGVQDQQINKTSAVRGPTIAGSQDLSVHEINPESLRLDNTKLNPRNLRFDDLDLDHRADLSVTGSPANSGCLSGSLKNQREFISCSPG